MRDLLAELNACNDVPIRSVYSEEFLPFGRVVTGFDFSGIVSYMEKETAIPAEGNVYVPSVDAMEADAEALKVRTRIYGGMPIQIGYCNGRNTTYNGFEYHKGSEINIAVTDFMLVLGHSYEIWDGKYDVSQASVFFVPKGTAIEMYQTTLHLSPLRVCDEGFKGVVILPRGTNTPLHDDERRERDAAIASLAGEQSFDEICMLLQRNKWVIAHPDREPLVKQGAYTGVTGVNRELHYPDY